MKKYVYNEILCPFKMMRKILITDMERFLGVILREKVGYKNLYVMILRA